MLNLIVSNGVAYVWNADDWFKLRTDHRIIGHFDGARISPGGTKSLPLKLSKVETQYLIRHGIAHTMEAPALRIPQAPTSEQCFLESRQQRIEFQLQEYKTKKRASIEVLVDKIIEGKRKKGKLVVPDRNSVIQEELDKTKLPYEFIQTDLEDPWMPTKDYIPLEFPLPCSPLEILRLRVFEDFHSVRKYFITSGTKFGGDFLAYPGDPTKFHAEFIIICETINNKIPKKLLISQQRLSQTVKKKLLIATWNANLGVVDYIECSASANPAEPENI